MKKFLAIILSSIILLLPIASYADTMYVANCNVSVSLRTYPSVNAEALTQVPLGAVVDSIGWENGFNQVIYDGLVGWILTDYLEVLSGDKDWDDHGDMMKVTNCQQWVTLRSYPSINASALTVVPLGEWIRSIGWENGFNQVEYNGYTGWILTSYLSYR